MKKLIIVESPSKIKTISSFLGKSFKILSTLGHIKDLPSKKMGVTMDGGIDIEYTVIEDKDKLIADIVKAAKDAEEIYLAPDPDREGEIIAWHVEQEIKKAIKKKSNIHRISFNEITKPAIEAALEHPRSVDLDKVAAQQARRVLDRWVGYEVSPILWRKISKGLSAGRVQSVALKMICDRENEIRAFKPQEYWTIDGHFTQASASLIAPLTHINKKKPEIATQQEADTIIADLKQTDFEIASIEDKKRTKNPPAPFMTSTLQQAAYNQLGFQVKKTMQLAQNLYEGVALADKDTPIALITYMRTDSLRLSETAISQVRTYISTNMDAAYLPEKAQVYISKKGKVQDAHEAVRPIDVTITPEQVKPYLTADQSKLYELIWRRFVSCQMTQAQYAQRQVTIAGGIYTFKVTGSTLIFDGFLKIYNATDDEEKEDKVVIPKTLQAQKPTELEKTDPKQHFTQPPPRYTEASLIKELEKEGVGRPSTYVAILNTIRARAYTTQDTKKRFVPSELGMAVSNMLTEHLPKIMNTAFTAAMEEDLDKIEQGDLKRDTLLKEFYEVFEKDLAAFRGEAKRSAEPTDITCPECKKGTLLIRFGKGDSFLGCSAYPECTFTTQFKRAEDGTIELVKQAAPELLDMPCPKCSKPLRRLIGKYGPFIACSGYPECKYIHQEKAPFSCPDDGGDVVKRKWRGGTFWGCGNYPKCKFAIFGDLEFTPCPQCKAPYLVKKTLKSGTTLSCHNKACGYKEKVE